MPTKKRTTTKPKRHATSQDAERDAIRAGLRRAVQRERSIQQLTKQLDRARRFADATVTAFVTGYAVTHNHEVIHRDRLAELRAKAGEQ